MWNLTDYIAAEIRDILQPDIRVTEDLVLMTTLNMGKIFRELAF